MGKPECACGHCDTKRVVNQLGQDTDVSKGKLHGLNPMEVIRQISKWSLFDSQKFIDDDKIDLETTFELAAFLIKKANIQIAENLMMAEGRTEMRRKIKSTHDHLKEHGHICDSEKCEEDMFQTMVSRGRPTDAQSQ